MRRAIFRVVPAVKEDRFWESTGRVEGAWTGGGGDGTYWRLSPCDGEAGKCVGVTATMCRTVGMQGTPPSVALEALRSLTGTEGQWPTIAMAAALFLRATGRQALALVADTPAHVEPFEVARAGPVNGLPITGEAVVIVMRRVLVGDDQTFWHVDLVVDQHGAVVTVSTECDAAASSEMFNNSEWQ